MKAFLGDAVMTYPLISAIEANCPEVIVLTSNPVAQVLQTDQGQRVFRPLPKSKKTRDVLKHAMEIRRLRCDAAVMVNHSVRSALVAKLAGIKKRIGHPQEHRGWLLTDRVPYDQVRFESICNGELCGPLGITPPVENPVLWLSETEKARGRELIEGATFGLQPGARFTAKRVPYEVTAEVARRLIAKGERPILMGGPDEKASEEKLQALLEAPLPSLVGKTNIRETMGALASLKGMLGSDTGLMHLAVGSGCASVQVFGPTPASKWGHAYGRNRVIQAAGGDMANTDLEEVFAAVESLLH